VGKVYIEFVLGKVLGYSAYLQDAQSLEAYSLIRSQVDIFPSLHMPDESIEGSESGYYKRMTGFYAGFFSWFSVDMTAIVFKRIFVPPTKQTAQTLKEKSLLSYFVDQVLVRFFQARKFSMKEVASFYKAWDPDRLVLQTYN
jgi:hypothetical protein